jgi:hypothetical protein
MEQQYRYTKNMLTDGETSTYFDNQALAGMAGPFAFMHSH